MYIWCAWYGGGERERMYMCVVNSEAALAPWLVQGGAEKEEEEEGEEEESARQGERGRIQTAPTYRSSPL